MDGAPLDNPTVTIAIALVAGIVSQTVGIHLRVPGIVLLLGVGVVLGPDVLNVVHPEALGEALSALVGFAVAVILFEGGMNLSIPHIKRAGSVIQRLITIGALITALGAALSVWLIMDWPWTLAALFGSLMIVTGPTVVTPLVRRLRLEPGVATVLEAEGVLIDPIGAIAAFVVLEVVLHPSHLLIGPGDLVMRLTVGALIGIVGGVVLSRLLRARGVVPEGLANISTLAAVYGLYTFSQWLTHESGIAAVTAAGITVRYLGTPVQRELLEFKEQLTVMLLGLLFVLLAADVRLADIYALGWAGVGTVAALIFLIRPLNVFASTVGTDLSWRQRIFLSWIAPRGIVAAAVASLFSLELDRAGMPGGSDLRALVFLVISVTVVLSGLTGGSVARALSLRRPARSGWVALGAHPLARQFAQAMIDEGEDVLLVDVNPEHCRAADDEGIRVVQGNVMHDGTLDESELDTRMGAIGLTRNEEVNFLFVQKARSEGGIVKLLVSLSNALTGITPTMVHEGRARVAFGLAHMVEHWDARIEHGTAALRRYTKDTSSGRATQIDLPEQAVPMVLVRDGVPQPVDDRVLFEAEDELIVLVNLECEDPVREALAELGFRAS